MQSHVVVLCVIVGVLGLITVILGFVGEATRSKSLVRYDGVKCVYRSTPALGGGVVGALFLLAGQIVVTAAAGCCGCCKTRALPAGTKRVVTVILSVISWILVIIAMGLFIGGASWNASTTRPPAREAVSYHECAVLDPGVFASASVLALIAVSFGIASYILLETTAASSGPPPPTTSPLQQQPRPGGFGQAIAMGQPQFHHPQAYPATAGYPAQANPPAMGYPPPPPQYGARAGQGGTSTF